MTMVARRWLYRRTGFTACRAPNSVIVVRHGVDATCGALVIKIRG